LLSQFAISSLEVTNCYLHFTLVDDTCLLIPATPPGCRPGSQRRNSKNHEGRKRI